MSAFVAFNGFPGQDVRDPIGTLLLQEKQAAVSVPAKPVRVRVLATSKAPAAATSHRRAALRRAVAPRASTGPVEQRTPSTQAPTSSPQAPSSAGTTQTAPPVSQPKAPVDTGSAPTLPDTGLPIPPITLPSLPTPPPPSGDSKLPIDTSGITDLLGGGK